MDDAVTCVVPGGKRPSQVQDNAAATDFTPLDAATMQAVKSIYERLIHPQVQDLW